MRWSCTYRLVDVGVEFERLLAVGAFDLLFAGTPRHAQQRVWVLLGAGGIHGAACMWWWPVVGVWKRCTVVLAYLRVGDACGCLGRAGRRGNGLLL